MLVIPTVTLPFGDGDGNGVVDIYDIALAAMNFGENAGNCYAALIPQTNLVRPKRLH